MKQHDEFKIELLIINKPSIDVPTFYVCFFVELTFQKWCSHTHTYTYIYACVEARHENEKCSSVPWQWESFEGPSLVDPAGTPNEKSPSHPSWDATQQNITRSHRQFRRSGVVFIRPESFSSILEKTIPRDFQFSADFFPHPFEMNFLTSNEQYFKIAKNCREE